MRIAQVAPLSESVPPKLYGGTERVVSYLTETLIDHHHEVTLFASGDAVTRAQLIPCAPQALRLHKACRDTLAYHCLMLEKVAQLAPEFDIIHFHLDYLHFPLSRARHLPQLTTLHGRLDLPELVPLYRAFREMPLVSISHYQRRPLAFANWQATVYHGLPENAYKFYPTNAGYLAFLGRICPEKRVDRAIDIAIQAGRELKIAAKVDKVDQEYYETQIKPLLNHPLVEFIGEINETEKNAFLGKAAALLFPIDWPEPFGLVMIEALACGTPVIAYPHGSVPEILEDGKTGFLVEDSAQAVAAVDKINTLSRWYCRQTFENRFSASRMTRDYLTLYEAFTAEPKLTPRLAL